VLITETGQRVSVKQATLLLGFRDLVAERMGYFLGRRLTQQEMSEKTEAERKAVAEVREKITGENLETIITNGDIATFKATLEELKTARKTLKDASEPFREKMNPLGKAVRYIDSVAVPDALKELGTPVQPRFSLSKWVNDAVEQASKKKQKQA